MHTFTCVLALQLAHLLRLQARRAGHDLSVKALLDTLAGIQETVLIYPSTGGRPKARRITTDMTADQASPPRPVRPPPMGPDPRLRSYARTSAKTALTCNDTIQDQLIQETPARLSADRDGLMAPPRRPRRTALPERAGGCAPTSGYERWRRGTPAARLAALLRSWPTLPALPLLVGPDAPALLSDEAERAGAAGAGQALTEALRALPEGHGVP